MLKNVSTIKYKTKVLFKKKDSKKQKSLKINNIYKNEWNKCKQYLFGITTSCTYSWYCNKLKHFHIKLKILLQIYAYHSNHFFFQKNLTHNHFAFHKILNP